MKVTVLIFWRGKFLWWDEMRFSKLGLSQINLVSTRTCDRVGMFWRMSCRNLGLVGVL